MMRNDSCRALIATFDEFPASILGCYGNEWIETPQADRLASAGVVADRCWAARVGATTAEEAFDALSLLTYLRAQNIRTALICEAGCQVDFSSAGFDAVHAVVGETGLNAKPDRMALASAVRVAQDLWESAEADNSLGLVWIHCRGLPIPSQPPAGFADLYRDEFEDRGVDFAELSDADRQLHPSTAAGMASLLDHWLGEFFALADSSDARPTLKVLTAAQGSVWQPLPDSFGELDELRSQTAQVPLILGSESAAPTGLRTDANISTRNLGPMLESWFRNRYRSANGDDDLVRCAASPAEGVVSRGATCGVRISTPQWAAIFPGETVADVSIAKPLLFRKPEDYWEVNDLAAIEPETVRELSERVQRLGATGSSDPIGSG